MRKINRLQGRPLIGVIVLALGLGLLPRVSAQNAEVPAPARLLTRDEAIHHALEHNPSLMTVRKQYGIAEATIVIAKTYPFNPAFVGYVAPCGGPTTANITNRVQLEDYMTLELELRGQGRIRRAQADATKTRIEAEISQQEIAVSIGVIRAYNLVLYRQKKLEFFEEGLKITQFQFDKLREQKNLRDTDLMLARADLEGARAQRYQSRAVLAVARSELRRLLGTLDDSFAVSGQVDVPLPSTDRQVLTELALNLRPDLRARKAALCEAESSLKMVVANRFGNISAGPFFEYDPGQITYVGTRIGFNLPVLNLKKGEILMAQTVVSRVQSEVYQVELQVSQDVLAALSRLADATQWARSIYKEVLPNLSSSKIAMEKIFSDNDPKVDLPRYLSVQRAYLKASENFLDACFEVSQAEADLAQAVAEPALALGASGHSKNVSGKGQ